MYEIWKDVKGFEGLYKISNLGRVKSLPRNGTVPYEKILKPNIMRDGYCQITLYKYNKPSWHKIHRLVATNFIPNLNNFEVVNHKDGNKQNNNVDNLEWCTPSYNIRHSCHVLHNNVKPIEQYSRENVFIKKWNSISEASEKLKIIGPNIVECCKGRRKTAGNFIWKYFEEG